MPKALKSCPKSNKLPNLVTLFTTASFFFLSFCFLWLTLSNNVNCTYCCLIVWLFSLLSRVQINSAQNIFWYRLYLLTGSRCTNSKAEHKFWHALYFFDLVPSICLLQTKFAARPISPKETNGWRQLRKLNKNINIVKVALLHWHVYLFFASFTWSFSN